jgi:hypothetical protein
MVSQPNNPSVTEDIHTRQQKLTDDINSGSIDRVHADMLDDARAFGAARAQQIYAGASKDAYMWRLGFPRHSVLSGVQGDDVIAQSGEGQDRKYVERSVHSWIGDTRTAVAPSSGAMDLGTRGHSTMSINTDGSGTVTMGGKDALWTVAQKIVEQRQGRSTQTDIGNLVNDITAYNRQTNPSFNPDNPPRQFDVPAVVSDSTGIANPSMYNPDRPGSRMATRDLPGTVIPGTSGGHGEPQMVDSVTPPGLTARPGEKYDDTDTHAGWRTPTGDQYPPADRYGNTTRTYDGGLYNGLFNTLFNTHFTAKETVDAHGTLQNSHVDYTSNQVGMKVKLADGTVQSIPEVKSVDVAYNPGRGHYTTTYISNNGDSLTTYTDRNGNVSMAGHVSLKGSG